MHNPELDVVGSDPVSEFIFIYPVLFSTQLIVTSIGPNFPIAFVILSVSKNSRAYFGIFSGAIMVSLTLLEPLCSLLNNLIYQPRKRS